MKRILSLTLALALMAAVFTACGCEANVSTHPGGMITEETTRPTVMPTPTATHATDPRDTTLPTVNGSDPTGEGSMPNSGGGSNGMNGGTGSGSTGGTGSNGTNGNSGTGSSESTTPTDSTMEQRGRNRNTAR